MQFRGIEHVQLSPLVPEHSHHPKGHPDPLNTDSPSPSLQPSQHHWSACCFCGFAYSEHFLYAESHDTAFVSGPFHSALCFQGSSMS